MAAGRRPSSQSSSQTSKTASVRPSSQPVRSASLPALARPVIEAKAGRPRNLVPVPQQERGTGPGACICDRRLFPPKFKVVKPCECQGTCTCGAGQYLPPFAQRGKICLCRKSKGNVYNAEVYSALQTRGGALWERLGSEARSLREREGFEKRMQKPSLQACQLCMRPLVETHVGPEAPTRCSGCQHRYHRKCIDRRRARGCPQCGKQWEDEDEIQHCVICHDPLVDTLVGLEAPTKWSGCEHRYHLKCIGGMRARNLSQCPQCRQDWDPSGDQELERKLSNALQHCGICQYPLVDTLVGLEAPTKWSGCEHRYHLKCIGRLRHHSIRNLKCPQCRQDWDPSGDQELDRKLIEHDFNALQDTLDPAQIAQTS